LSWLKTAPTPEPEASVSSTNGSLKLGIAKIGEDVMACLSTTKVVVALSVQRNAYFFNNSVNGATI